MLLVSVAIFVALYYVLARTRIGMIIQAALSYPKTVEALDTTCLWFLWAYLELERD